MTSWHELGSFIRANYPVAEETAERFVLVFRISITGDRTQVLHVAEQSAINGEEWAHIVSPVGRFGEFDIERLLGELGDSGRGGLAMLGDKVVIRHSIHLPSFDVSAFGTAMSLVAMQADFAELRFVGGDEF
jgi:hypothetical protein